MTNLQVLEQACRARRGLSWQDCIDEHGNHAWWIRDHTGLRWLAYHISTEYHRLMAERNEP